MKDLDISQVFARPYLFKRFMEQNKLTPDAFDELALKQEPQKAQRYINYCNSIVLSYGLYPVPASVIKARTMGNDVGIPLSILGMCANDTGRARDILDTLYLKYFTVSNCDIEKEHFFKLFNLRKKDIKKFEALYEELHGDVAETCIRLEIDTRSLYRQTLIAPPGQEVFKSNLPNTIQGADDAN